MKVKTSVVIFAPLYCNITLSLYRTEIHHRALNDKISEVIGLFQTLFQHLSCIKWRCEPALFCEYVPYKAVGDLRLSSYVKAGYEFSALFQHAEGLAECSFLIGKCVKAVHAQNNVKCAVFIRKFPDIAL